MEILLYLLTRRVETVHAVQSYYLINLDSTILPKNVYFTIYKELFCYLLETDID